MPPTLPRIAAIALGLMATMVHAGPQRLESAVIEEINHARTQPQDYARMLRQYRQSYSGYLVDDPDEPGDHMTREGVRAVDEAIRFLEAQTPLPPLAPGDVLARAAADMAAEQGARGDVGHISASGLNPGQRVVRRGGGIYVAETIAYGFSTPIAVVRQLIVDDGVADRGHRTVIFSPTLRYAGAGCGPHPVYSAMCVIDFGETSDGRPPMPPHR